VEEPEFLTLAEVLYLHDESLARFGGSAGVRDQGLVGSARNVLWYGNGGLFEIAAAYAFHIAECQAFVDGNKRTAAASAIMFLRKNRIQFPADDGSVYAAMIDIANKRLDKRGLAETLRRLVESAPEK